MKQMRFFHCRVAFLATCLLASISPNALRAQSLWSVPVGGTASTLSHLGPVSGESSYRGMDVYLWSLANGNRFTATVNREGEVVFAESDWLGKSDDTGCDLAGLKFGVTTQAELRKRLGSDGFAFRLRGHSMQAEDGVAMMDSWEIDKVVVTFYTKISKEDYARVQAEGSKESAADFAKLYAISIANDAYARAEWGARLGAAPSKKTVWK